MDKSAHNYDRFTDISIDELTNFINPINASYPIDKESLLKLFKDNIDVRDYINTFYTQVLGHFTFMTLNDKTDFIRHYATISYVPHTTGYDFRFYPVDFVNSLFKYLNLPYQVPFINLDNGYGKSYFKDYVRAYINDYKRTGVQTDINYDYKLQILIALSLYLDEINEMYDVSIDNMVNQNVVPKDMLLYLAFKGLSMYEETQDEVYLVLPMEYYKYVSHMSTSPFPHKINYEGKKQWFPEFRAKYESIVDPSLVIDDSKYMLNDHELLLSWDILKPGMLEREIRDVRDVGRSISDIDYDKYMRLFEAKMNYYMKSPYVHYIKGKYGLLGYVGFSYTNDYLVFDKFHNSETVDPKDKTILTHGEAIFAVPADRFNIVRADKQRIIKAKKRDPRIKKINHTPNYSFLNKLDGVIHGPNVSLQSFEDVIEQQKKRILINH